MGARVAYGLGALNDDLSSYVVMIKINTLGIDHERFAYRHQGLDSRLTGVEKPREEWKVGVG